MFDDFVWLEEVKLLVLNILKTSDDISIDDEVEVNSLETELLESEITNSVLEVTEVELDSIV